MPGFLVGAARIRLGALQYQVGGRILLDYHLFHVSGW